MKITEYGITVVYLMILCRIAYADWKYQIIEPWTHIGILTLACMEMLFRVGVSVQERCLGAVVIAVPMLVLTVLLKGGFGGGDIKLMAVSGFLNGVKIITYAVESWSISMKTDTPTSLISARASSLSPPCSSVCRDERTVLLLVPFLLWELLE